MSPGSCVGQALRLRSAPLLTPWSATAKVVSSARSAAAISAGPTQREPRRADLLQQHGA